MSAGADWKAPDYAARARVDGRTFMLLGGGDGLGRATAHALVQAGARLVCVDRDADNANALASEVDGLAVAADITRRSEVERALCAAKEAFGPVSGLVDIVGVATLGPIQEIDDRLWRAQFEAVVDHAYLAIQIVGRAIAEAGGGSMVFIGSISGVAAVGGQTAYGAAKAALHQLVACAGVELAADGVRVNAVAPGFVRTPRLDATVGKEGWARIGRAIPRGSAGDPVEIASAVLFFAAESSSYVTGQVLVADGGLSGFVPLPPVWHKKSAPLVSRN